VLLIPDRSNLTSDAGGKYGGETMLATFAFDVCHDVYLAAREAIDAKIPTLSPEASGKYQWRPDRMPRLAEYVCDFARAGERALGGSNTDLRSCQARFSLRPLERHQRKLPQAEACATVRRPSPSQPTFRASRLVMFRVYYLGGADYQAARRHLGIGEFTWADWADEIRRRVGRELTRAGVFPPARYFREAS
jgi:hypothetical protein